MRPDGIYMPRKIGIFDSGLGGLTILRALEDRALADEQLIYLGDTARVPYGPKSPSTIRKYALQAARFFSEMGVDTMVIACHSASAVAVEVVSKIFPRMKVIGVIEPGVQEAMSLLEKENRDIEFVRLGVISTRGTHRSEAYANAIRSRNPSVQVISQPCPLFVALVEEGWAGTEVARAVAAEYLAPFLLTPVETLILGCTHYPILLDEIRSIMPDSTRIIDCAEPTSREVFGKREINTERRNTVFFVTDVSDRFGELAGRFLGRQVDNITCVDLEPEPLERP